MNVTIEQLAALALELADARLEKERAIALVRQARAELADALERDERAK